MCVRGHSADRPMMKDASSDAHRRDRYVATKTDAAVCEASMRNTPTLFSLLPLPGDRRVMAPLVRDHYGGGSQAAIIRSAPEAPPYVYGAKIHTPDNDVASIG
jgi:hypothetical protein